MTSKNAELEKALLEFATYFKCAQLDSCRLVHYSGVGQPNAIDVSMSDVESQIVGCLAEGFKVQWIAEGNRLYIAVQEPDCPTPSWEKVFAEEALVDVNELLKRVGLY
ncbi:hypothetical protein [Undibacterium macrobrachii]|jgi:hypothetical protein|uniref:Uncharacterized protein n=1 Tax=Undibacterium macrobrachii TaxID=1119058 RepID=A0ABQ2XDV3_9BURK|nr:hypothetical protein [Undibacterium macrobrachii]GGX11664.1 hypothetical protein GCM10011282_17660 [Undibacterium macrobrachii]